MKNSFTTDYADFRDHIKNNLKSGYDYADYADFRDYIKRNFTTDYAENADFRNYIKIISPLTTLILETT